MIMHSPEEINAMFDRILQPPLPPEPVREDPHRGALLLGMLTIGVIMFAWGMVIGLVVGRAM